jgi:hypothetical protein
VPLTSLLPIRVSGLSSLGPERSEIGPRRFVFVGKVTVLFGASNVEVEFRPDPP